MLPNFTYLRPASLKEAIKELASPDAWLHAGGADLLGCLRDGVFPAKKLVAIGGLAELRGIAPAAGGSLRIGALTSLAEIAASPLIAARYRALAQGAASAASPQLRNQATLGGNLCQRPRCWYYRGDFQCLRKGGDKCYALEAENEFHCIFGGEGCYIVHPSDTAPALVALQARARIAGPGGARGVPLQPFFLPPAKDFTRENVLEPGEILTEILLPPPPQGLRSSYRKVRVRGSWDFGLAGVALALKATDGRTEWAGIVLSGAAPVPWRATEAEKALTGQRLDAQTASRVAAASLRSAAPLPQNGYKLDLVRGIVEEALMAMS